MATLFLLCALLNTASALEVLPNHFHLHPGEQIHYTVLEHSGIGRPRFVDYEYSVENPAILRRVGTTNVLEAVRPGRTELFVRTATSARRLTIEVSGPAQPSMPAVPHTALNEIAAKEFLFVGHANRDGFDHTAVAKPGIDALVRKAKTNAAPPASMLVQDLTPRTRSVSTLDESFSQAGASCFVYCGTRR